MLTKDYYITVYCQKSPQHSKNIERQTKLLLWKTNAVMSNNGQLFISVVDRKGNQLRSCWMLSSVL
jgi:hypothetical protein